MDSCCKTGYDKTFGMKRAQKEMERYLRKGPKKSTRWLLESIEPRVQHGDTVLDIGGGVGAFIMELQKQGVGTSYYMDISESYSAVFRHEVGKQRIDDSIQIHTGDFTEKHHLIPETDIVALDKVLCCYHDYQQLLSLALQKTRRILAYTIPDDVWWVRYTHQVETWFKTWFTNYLITYIHPVAQLESLVLDQRFHKIYEKSHNGWLTVVYTILNE